MLKKELRLNANLLLVVSLVVALSIGSLAGFLWHYDSLYPNVSGLASKGDLVRLASYLYGEVEVGAPGNISLVAYVRPGAEANFLGTALPEFETEFVKAGRVEYLQKEYLTLLDIKQKTPELALALESYCRRDPAGCESGQVPESLLRGAEECSRFGLPGASPLLVISRGGREIAAFAGVPKYAQLRKVLRQGLMEAGR